MQCAQPAVLTRIALPAILTATMPHDELMIRVHGLSKHFRTLSKREGLAGSFKDLFSRNYTLVKAVDEISMEIRRGEVVGFIGPNGAGKSTTIKMLSGVLKPTRGEISCNGVVPFRNRKRYVKNIGVVFGQRSQLWWDLPVIESFKLLRAIYEIDPTEYKENLDLFTEIVNLDKLFLTPVRNLSLGQRMICDIAASFLHNPEIIFLDEPSIGLDIAVRSKVREIIGKLNRIKKTTILITSHDTADIEVLCPRVILIDKGKVLYDGELQRFNRLFGSYRTLRLDLGEGETGALGSIAARLRERFPGEDSVQTRKEESGWVEVTVNQEAAPLLDVLNLIMSSFPVKDIQIQEMNLGDVIKKIYNGAVI